MTYLSTSRSIARYGGPLLFVACAAYEIVWIALGHEWPGFVPSVRVGIGLMNVALWLASAAVLALRTSKALWVPVYGAFMLLTEAIVARASGSQRELVYLAVFPVIVVLETIDIREVLGIEREYVHGAAVPVTA